MLVVGSTVTAFHCRVALTVPEPTILVPCGDLGKPVEVGVEGEDHGFWKQNMLPEIPCLTISTPV